MKKATVLIIALMLLFSGTACEDNPRKGNRENNIVHSKNPDPPQGDWKQFAEVLKNVGNVCEAFRSNTDKQLVTAKTEGTITQWTSRDGVPGDFVKLVGDYYRGGLDPSTKDGEAALRIRRGKITDWCKANKV